MTAPALESSVSETYHSLPSHEINFHLLIQQEPPEFGNNGNSPIIHGKGPTKSTQSSTYLPSYSPAFREPRTFHMHHNVSSASKFSSRSPSGDQASHTLIATGHNILESSHLNMLMFLQIFPRLRVIHPHKGFAEPNHP